MKTIEQIRDAFHLIHHVAIGTSDRPYMSIPADPNRDADLIVSAAIDELSSARAEIERLKQSRDELLEACEALLCKHSKCACGTELARAAISKARGEKP